MLVGRLPVGGVIKGEDRPTNGRVAPAGHTKPDVAVPHGEQEPSGVPSRVLSDQQLEGCRSEERAGTVQASDSVRVSIDGNWLYNQAGANQAEVREFEVNLAAGRHVIVVQYFAGTGPAIIRFDYQPAGQP